MKRLIAILLIIMFAFFSYAQHYKKDGTPDMRYKENRSTYAPSVTPTYTPTSTSTYTPSNNGTHLKKDGTPDMRFKENKSTYTAPDIPTFNSPSTPSYNTSNNTGIHLKKDGTPDMRYKENNPKYDYAAPRDKNGKIMRSEAAINDFKKQTGYPNGRPGYVIDHIVPLKKGGCDCPDNMQWQTIEEAKAKDKWE